VERSSLSAIFSPAGRAPTQPWTELARLAIGGLPLRYAVPGRHLRLQLACPDYGLIRVVPARRRRPACSSSTPPAERDWGAAATRAIQQGAMSRPSVPQWVPCATYFVGGEEFQYPRICSVKFS
jgi:hypothetical protein